jgi:hypothetical protein
MAAQKIFTAAEVEDLVSKILTRSKKDDKPKEKVDLEEALRRQDARILKGELAREKKDRIRSVAHNPKASTADKIEAIGGETALTPFQLLKLHDHATPDRQKLAALEPPPVDLLRQVLGKRPSSNEMARYYDIAEILQGAVRQGPLGPEGPSIEVNGEQIPGDLMKVIRYLIKGTRGHAQGPPAGVVDIAALLREGGVKRSRFPPGIRPLLGGGAATPVMATPRRQLPNVVDTLQRLPLTYLPQTSNPPSSDDEEGEQSGSGLQILKTAMNLAEKEDHAGAWKALYTARQMKAPRHQLKQAESYCSQYRDG